MLSTRVSKSAAAWSGASSEYGPSLRETFGDGDGDGGDAAGGGGGGCGGGGGGDDDDDVQL